MKRIAPQEIRSNMLPEPPRDEGSYRPYDGEAAAFFAAVLAVSPRRYGGGKRPEGTFP
jgi:hypothetical protein